MPRSKIPICSFVPHFLCSQNQSINKKKTLKKETDESDVNMRRRPSHRRQSSVGISFYRHEEQHTHRRRFSYASSSWIQNDDNDDDGEENSARTGRSRPCSWGPVGEFFYRESLCFSESERSPISHHECKFPSSLIYFIFIFGA